jgi:hypothetical protein
LQKQPQRQSHCRACLLLLLHRQLFSLPFSLLLLLMLAFVSTPAHRAHCEVQSEKENKPVPLKKVERYQLHEHTQKLCGHHNAALRHRLKASTTIRETPALEAKWSSIVNSRNHMSSAGTRLSLLRPFRVSGFPTFFLLSAGASLPPRLVLRLGVKTTHRTNEDADHCAERRAALAAAVNHAARATRYGGG